MNKQSILVTTAISLTCSLLVLCVALAMIPQPRDVGYVKLDEIIGNHVQSYGLKELNDDERKVVSEQFAKALEYSLNQITVTGNVNLFVDKAVVRGGTDYTPLVSALIASKMDRKE